MTIPISISTDITWPKKIEYLEGHMLSLPQAECPVLHHFGPGIYIREVYLSAGIIAIGHNQRLKHLNTIIQGSVVMVGDHGQLKTIKAPSTFIGHPGRKVGYVLEDTIWQNIYGTTETDISILEATYLDKSLTWQKYNEGLRKFYAASHSPDRADFNLLLNESGFTTDQVRSQSEDESDQIPMPGEFPKITFRDSYIEGVGTFLSTSAQPGEELGPARINSKRTPLGRYTNHSKSPNAEFRLTDEDDVYLFATKEISGCLAGSKGEEVTIDYRQALSLSGIMIGDQL